MQATYAGFEPAVPAFAWDGIEARLDKKKRGGFGWWHAAAIALLITGAAVVLMNRQEQQTSGKSTPQTSQSSDNSTHSQPGAQPQTESAEDQSAATDNTNTTGGEKASGNGAGSKDGGSKGIYNNQDPQTHSEDVADELPPVEELQEPEVQATEQYSIGANLEPFGVREEDIQAGETNALVLSEIRKIKNNIGPSLQMHGRGFIGFGVGQLVSTTGVSINPEYKEYVHKNYEQRLQEGEGLLSSLSFVGTAGYRIVGNHYVFSGVNYYQRRNSLNYDFIDAAVSRDATKPMDAFGNYPIKENGYLPVGTREVHFKGTNVFTSFDIPVGWMGMFPVAKKWTVIPSASANLGFVSVSSSNSDLHYQFLTVEGVNKDQYRKKIVSLNTSAGVYRDLNAYLKWGISATGNYTLSQMYIPGATVRPRAFTGGLNTQLIWRLY